MNLGTLSREELIVLGNRLLAARTEEESDKLYEEFKRQFSHPDAANLLYFPENYNARIHDISDYNPSVDEIVDLAISHKPIYH